MKKTLLALMATIMALGAQALPRAEYPRPQFERAEWMNLNGEWNFAFDFGQTGQQREWQKATSFDKKITVPFCPESSLSGIGYTDFIPAVWYQRTLDIPADWQGKQVRLNFGASDYETHVFIDGREIGVHYGSGSSFSFDITRQAQPGTTHNLVVWVKDNLRGRHQTGGKQSPDFYSSGCLYTRTTGIWQAVRLFCLVLCDLSYLRNDFAGFVDRNRIANPNAQLWKPSDGEGVRRQETGGFCFGGLFQWSHGGAPHQEHEAVVARVTIPL